MYRERYQGFNARHFHQLAWRQHAVPFCYLREEGAAERRPGGQAAATGTPSAPPGAAAVLRRAAASGRQPNQLLALVPEQWFTMLVVVDDATEQVLYAQLCPGGESVAAVMTALRAVLRRYGVPIALDTDRGHWAVHTPVAGGSPDRTRLTQVGRALARLGIGHILGYSPQARARPQGTVWAQSAR